MHIHIASMHLGTQTSLDAACGVLLHCNDLVEKYLTTSPVLRFKGLKLYDTGASVSTDICDAPTELASLVRELRLRFWSLGYVAKASEMPPRIPFFEGNVIPSGAEFALSDGKVSVWSPRITLMKLHGADLSRKKREATASFKSATKHNNGVVVEDGIARKLTLNDFFGIPASVIQRFENHDFGSQTVERLDLLSLVNNTGHIEYNIAGRCGVTHYMYFKPGMTAMEVINDLIKNEHITGDEDIAGLHIAVSTDNSCQRSVDNLGVNLEMKPGMEMHMQVTSRETQDYAERELQTTPELFLVSV
ncbi:hypothetical protein GGI01_002500 [Coemansia sp. RSA 376]|nr:hypothetical protein GGI01_002500 [Coemansia sp. RSA 376]